MTAHGFRSKAALRAAVRAIVNPHAPGTTLDADEQAWMLVVLQRHPDWLAKQGCGVARIEVRTNYAATGVGLHVDHHPISFATLIAGWLDGRVVPLADAGTYSTFADPADALDWQEHHRLFAGLRLVHARGNLSKKGCSE